MKLKMKLSALAGAVALAAAGQAFAAGTGDLFLSVYDSTNTTFFTEDLGVASTSLRSLVSTGVGSQTFAADSNLNSFLAAAGAADTIVWNVTGQITGPENTSATSEAFITTSTATTFPTTQLNSSIATVTGNLTTYYSGSVAYQANGLLSGSTAATAALEGGMNGGNYIKPVTTNALGSSMDMFFVTPSSTSGVGKASGVLFGHANTAADVWTLSSTGALSVASVAAVPEPGEWLLMLSGLGLIGFIATRRKNQGSALNFA